MENHTSQQHSCQSKPGKCLNVFQISKKKPQEHKTQPSSKAPKPPPPEDSAISIYSFLSYISAIKDLTSLSIAVSWRMVNSSLENRILETAKR